MSAFEEKSVLFSHPVDQAVRLLLQTHGLRAKKSWGQNFLIDASAYKAIVEAARLQTGDVVVEIGAGLGTLTARLLQTGAQVTAVEREHDMCHVLRQELETHPAFELREENALQFDFASFFERHKQPLVVIGNLPYQIASPLLFHCLESRAMIARMVFMVQREVAERMYAQPGTRAYSALSAQVQMLAHVQKVRHVGPGAFVPPPRVESTIVSITPVATTRVPVRTLESYRKVVQAAFAMRRKTLRNALQAAFGVNAEIALTYANIDPMRRGETLSVSEFAKLADGLPSL